MTTVCYRAGVLAADTRSYVGDTIVSHRALKILRLKDGRMAGWSGTLSLGLPLARWIEAGKEGPRPVADLSLIEVRPDGTFILHDEHGECPQVTDSDFIALGSGAPAAMAAMHMGADAREAVRIAMLVDPWTGGNVQSLELQAEKPEAVATAGVPWCQGEDFVRWLDDPAVEGFGDGPRRLVVIPSRFPAGSDWPVPAAGF